MKAQTFFNVEFVCCVDKTSRFKPALTAALLLEVLTDARKSPITNDCTFPKNPKSEKVTLSNFVIAQQNLWFAF